MNFFSSSCHTQYQPLVYFTISNNEKCTYIYIFTINLRISFQDSQPKCLSSIMRIIIKANIPISSISSGNFKITIKDQKDRKKTT